MGLTGHRTFFKGPTKSTKGSDHKASICFRCRKGLCQLVWWLDKANFEVNTLEHAPYEERSNQKIEMWQLSPTLGEVCKADHVVNCQVDHV